MFTYIPEQEYMLTSKEALIYLNQHQGTFNKELNSTDLSNWTRNFEINAIKPIGTTRWRYRDADLKDFVYRYQHNMLHKFNDSYRTRTSCRIPEIILRDFFIEERTFQVTTCILVTLHPYALFNDPERSYRNLYRAEGGIIFKDAAVHFSTHSVGPKTTELELRQQRLMYPVLVAEAINELASEYSRTEGDSIQDKIIKAGWTLISGRITKETFMDELDSMSRILRGWTGLNSTLHNEITPIIFGKVIEDI
ncbi:hypothetical protein OM416_19635 [Paenibacillus sp. LS1]|uniref:hypothetical protein n=1 Tax=Paenibacillus sp. LS1 TaxID=2992120 RepID=UPI00222F370E|nr:hypothetical protein [Paenibacillus sp. LS1]MCW3793808.1 hypothetical protein [Paenibacillus sp. LS1]